MSPLINPLLNPVNPPWLTLRVCADMRWKVHVDCPRCRWTTLLVVERYADGPLGKRTLVDLLEAGAFRCRKPPCERAYADRLTVGAQDVGVTRDIAVWTVAEVNGRRVAQPAPVRG